MANMAINIRKSTEADIPAIFLMLKEFTVFQKTPEKLLVTAQQMKEDKALFNCFVAEDTATSEMAGYACYSLIYYSWIGKALYLDDLYVRDNFRGQNIGTLLMNSVIEFAKENNIEIDIEPNQDEELVEANKVEKLEIEIIISVILQINISKFND